MEYMYNDTPGMIEVVDVNSKRIYFLDHYNFVHREHVVDFRWSTWDVHIDSTIRVVNVLSNEPDWEL